MYKKGSIIKFDYKHDGIVEKDHVFILADCFETEFIFQIICIEGYHRGTIEGLIRKEEGEIGSIKKEHLVKELNRNFINILWNTFEDLN